MHQPRPHKAAGATLPSNLGEASGIGYASFSSPPTMNPIMAGARTSLWTISPEGHLR